MMIEGAERFGLAQLYQLRGRVGRSAYQSYCFLFADVWSEKIRERLQALLKTKNGFELAELDLKMRGAGEIYGTKQSGFPELKIATLFDYEIIQRGSVAAEKILDQDPELLRHPLLKKKIETMTRAVHLE
jgi:ATP-dependent DNA helicase RecG